MSVAGFGVVALGAAGGVASAGGLARVTIAIATATDSRTIPEGVLVALAGDQHYATLGKARLSAAMKCARSSPNVRPRGSRT